jgi:hypothetical protein
VSTFQSFSNLSNGKTWFAGRYQVTGVRDSGFEEVLVHLLPCFNDYLCTLCYRLVTPSSCVPPTAAGLTPLRSGHVHHPPTQTPEFAIIIPLINFSPSNSSRSSQQDEYLQVSWAGAATHRGRLFLRGGSTHSARCCCFRHPAG